MRPYLSIGLLALLLVGCAPSVCTHGIIDSVSFEKESAWCNSHGYERSLYWGHCSFANCTTSAAGVEFCKEQLVLIPGTPTECSKVKP